jgi:hypothetical protein
MWRDLKTVLFVPFAFITFAGLVTMPWWMLVLLALVVTGGAVIQSQASK